MSNNATERLFAEHPEWFLLKKIGDTLTQAGRTYTITRMFGDENKFFELKSVDPRYVDTYVRVDKIVDDKSGYIFKGINAAGLAGGKRRKSRRSRKNRRQTRRTRA